MIPRTLIITNSIDPVTGELAALGYGEDGQLHIDWQIRQALQHKRHPIIVMGRDGDDLLRASRLVRQCEFVFDPNEEFGFLASLKAGLIAVEKPAFYVAAHVRFPAALKWQHFGAELEPHERPYHLLTEAPEIAQIPSYVGFVTRKGVEFFQELSAMELQLNHPDLRVLVTELAAEPIVAA